jgi:hypothetical protein
MKIIDIKWKYRLMVSEKSMYIVAFQMQSIPKIIEEYHLPNGNTSEIVYTVNECHIL